MRKLTKFWKAFILFNVLSMFAGILLIPLYIIRYVYWMIGLVRNKKLKLATKMDHDSIKIRAEIEKFSGLDKVWRERYGTSFTRMGLVETKYTFWGNNMFSEY